MWKASLCVCERQRQRARAHATRTLNGRQRMKSKRTSQALHKSPNAFLIFGSMLSKAAIIFANMQLTNLDAAQIWSQLICTINGNVNLNPEKAQKQNPKSCPQKERGGGWENGRMEEWKNGRYQGCSLRSCRFETKACCVFGAGTVPWALLPGRRGASCADGSAEVPVRTTQEGWE